MSQDPSSSTSNNNTQSNEIEIVSDDESADLNYQPRIIKGRRGERLWLAENTRICSELCKSQLKVINILHTSV